MLRSRFPWRHRAPCPGYEGAGASRSAIIKLTKNRLHNALDKPGGTVKVGRGNGTRRGLACGRKILAHGIVTYHCGPVIGRTARTTS